MNSIALYRIRWTNDDDSSRNWFIVCIQIRCWWIRKLYLMNLMYKRRTNTVNVEWIVRRTTNAKRWMKRFTRKIQESCVSILTRRLNDSRSRKSLLNQRMSDFVYHSCWNFLMKQMSVMKEHMIRMKQRQMRSPNVRTYGILTWSNLKDIDESIFVKQKNTLMSFKCVKLYRTKRQLKKICNKRIITRKKYDSVSFNNLLNSQSEWFQHKKIRIFIF